MSEILIVVLFVFVLVLFVGFEVINKVLFILYIFLMFGVNVILGIVVLGVLIIVGDKDWNVIVILGLIFVVFVIINVVGGFLVMDRML